MKRALLALCLVPLMLAGAAAAVLAPGRTVSEPTPISSLGVTFRTVVYAVAERPRERCAYVRLWDTATGGLWRFGEETTRVCREGPSTGSGISSVSTSGRRVFWVTFVGGNLREYALWTATPTRRAARSLAEAASDVDSGERPLVLGSGTREGVPYAVRETITYVADDGRRLFRTSSGSPVRLLSAGIGPGFARVVAALADGRVVVLSRAGAVLRTIDEEPNAVKAVLLALPGPIVQVGRDVRVGSRSTTLPAGAQLLDYREGRVVYAAGAQVRSRRLATGADTLLQVLPGTASPRPLFATDAWGSAWARSTVVSWRAGPLP